MWKHFLSMIGVSESKAVERLSRGQLDFYDRMLEVWAADNLSIVNGAHHAKSSSHSCILNDCSNRIGPGTLVRAVSSPTNDMLLYDQEFIRCLILVVEDTKDATVGIILNHPMSAAIECKEGEDPMPLRYGGPIDVPSWKDGSYCQDAGESEFDNGSSNNDVKEEDDDEVYEGFLDYQQNGVQLDDFLFDNKMSEDFDMENDDDDNYDDDDDSSFIWIHRNTALGMQGPSRGGGTQLGSSSLWLIKEDDALQSIQSGNLSLKDVMVFSGVCIWEKGQDLGMCGGGLREQIDVLHSLEVVRACDDRNFDDAIVEDVWDILTKRQRVLTKESLDGNIKAVIHAWEMCTQCAVGDTDADESRTRLSDAALKAWLGVNLLEDPLGTLVEVRDDQRRESFDGR